MLLSKNYTKTQKIVESLEWRAETKTRCFSNQIVIRARLISPFEPQAHIHRASTEEKREKLIRVRARVCVRINRPFLWCKTRGDQILLKGEMSKIEIDD